MSSRGSPSCAAPGAPSSCWTNSKLTPHGRATRRKKPTLQPHGCGARAKKTEVEVCPIVTVAPWWRRTSTTPGPCSPWPMKTSCAYSRKSSYPPQYRGSRASRWWTAGSGAILGLSAGFLPEASHPAPPWRAPGPVSPTSRSLGTGCAWGPSSTVPRASARSVPMSPASSQQTPSSWILRVAKGWTRAATATMDKQRRGERSLSQRKCTP
mmetsp:Transcript_22850/g.66502  ORF Transcript_22850/g.66502 Transcript_22850/m.66502 type:complete len:210 (+) Transcript_22850:1007-1636(+)